MNINAMNDEKRERRLTIRTQTPYKCSIGRRAHSATLSFGAALVAILALTGLPGQAGAAWPERPIKLMVGYPPGGGTDTVARVYAPLLAEQLGQTVVIQNRAGASSTIAAGQVATAEPDGYTLFFTTASPLTLAPLTMPSLPYDPTKAFAPIIYVGGGPFLLVAHPSFPPNSLTELIAYAKANPGKVNYATPGASTANYFLTETMNLDTGIDTVHVPYKGSSELVNDLIGGQVQYTLETPGTTLPLIKQGKLKALAVHADKRLEKAPNVQTVVEAGYPQLVGGSWYGLLAPAGTPQAIIDKLYRASELVLAKPEMKKAMDDRDVIIGGYGPDKFTAFIDAEYAKWKSVTARVAAKRK